LDPPPPSSSPDIRSNENFSLLALHTLFIREHNRRCDWLIAQYPTWNDEQLYQSARRYVIALIQVGALFAGFPELRTHCCLPHMVPPRRLFSLVSRKSRTTSSCLP